MIRYTVSEKETPTGLISNLITPVSTRSDSGSFLCITWNPYGQSEMTSRVLVEEPPDPPSDLIAHEFGSKSISLRYSLPYSGNSPVTKYIIQWKKDGGKVEEEEEKKKDVTSFCNPIHLHHHLHPYHHSSCLS